MKRRYPLPQGVHALVEQTLGAVLLESADQLAAAPLTRLFRRPVRTLLAHDSSQVFPLFAELESAIEQGYWAAGYCAYECSTAFEPRVRLQKSLPGEPLAWFGLYPQCHTFDHQTGAWIGDAPVGLSDFASSPLASAAPPISVDLPIALYDYADRIAQIHEWIRRGDVYQLNFTQTMRFPWPGSPAALYAQLLANQPAEFAAFLHPLPGRHILSLSPELFFRVNDSLGERCIVTRPMKGTAPRGRTTAEDSCFAARLVTDEKNRSENLMIVDLLRNDLGRLCEFGSVRVENLFAVERLRTLFQMTSTITGTLRPATHYADIFRALFPSGSVTGAPKVRAIQLLSELESAPRGVYTGAIGFCASHEAVFNVAIRTIEIQDGMGRMGVGSGIVIDSDPASEFEECRLKAEFLARDLQPFQLIESLLWDGTYPLLALHIDRLADSAHYFGFECDPGAVALALEAHAAEFAHRTPRKVRLLLHQDGNIDISDNPIDDSISAAPPLRVILSRDRVHSSDTMLFHKTTHRPLYAQALAAAQHQGFDEVLFFNEHGQLTEGAISNVFIERDGTLLTPPVECGLLAGVYRRHLLATRSDVCEQVLSRADLDGARVIYLANAVRGLRPAEIVVPVASTTPVSELL